MISDRFWRKRGGGEGGGGAVEEGRRKRRGGGGEFCSKVSRSKSGWIGRVGLKCWYEDKAKAKDKAMHIKIFSQCKV